MFGKRALNELEKPSTIVCSTMHFTHKMFYLNSFPFKLLFSIKISFKFQLHLNKTTTQTQLFKLMISLHSVFSIEIEYQQIMPFPYESIN